MLTATLDHLINYVLPAAMEYELAERNLSQAEMAGAWNSEAILAKRKASELAVAVDGLADRANAELGGDIKILRSEISALCFWPGTEFRRDNAFERVFSVANAYKHFRLKDARNVVHSFDDVLVVLRRSRKMTHPCSPKLDHQSAPISRHLRRVWARGSRRRRADENVDR